MNLMPDVQRRSTLILASTVVFEGMRAGAGTFRLLLDLPARHRLGAVAFAEFSRATDLSTRGVVFYSLYGFGGALLTAATWLAARRARAPNNVRALAGISCICSLAVLLLTTQAAPLMWKVGSTLDEPAHLAELLDRFTFWTTLRIACVDVSFVALVAAMTLSSLGCRDPEGGAETTGLIRGRRVDGNPR